MRLFSIPFVEAESTVDLKDPPALHARPPDNPTRLDNYTIGKTERSMPLQNQAPESLEGDLKGPVQVLNETRFEIALVELQNRMGEAMWKFGMDVTMKTIWEMAKKVPKGYLKNCIKQSLYIGESHVAAEIAAGRKVHPQVTHMILVARHIIDNFDEVFELAKSSPEPQISFAALVHGGHVPHETRLPN